jgi:hypothetical protein
VLSKSKGESGYFPRIYQFFHAPSSDNKELERKDKFLPTVIQRDKKLDVNALLGNDSNISVRMYNNEGFQSFEDKHYVILTLNKRYDLSKVAKGTYMWKLLRAMTRSILRLICRKKDPSVKKPFFAQFRAKNGFFTEGSF